MCKADKCNFLRLNTCPIFSQFLHLISSSDAGFQECFVKHLDGLFPAWLDAQLCSLGCSGAGSEGTPRLPDTGDQALVRGEGWLGGSEEHLGKFGSFVCDCLLKTQRGLCTSRRCSVTPARRGVEMPPAALAPAQQKQTAVNFGKRILLSCLC